MWIHLSGSSNVEFLILELYQKFSTVCFIVYASHYGLMDYSLIRLENEHLNNVGKYRAFKSVPLPFNYDTDDEKDE